MRMNEVSYTDARPIDGYGPGFFRVAGKVIEGAALIHPKGAQGWGGYDDVQDIVAMADQLDVLIVGTGAEIANVPPAFRDALQEAGIGVELMASPPACRTYNVLLSEGRRIAAALLPG